MSIDAPLRPWLIGKGLLTMRLKAVCGERFSLRLVEQWTGLLERGTQAQRWASRTAPGCSARSRCAAAISVWVFAETIMPDSTLCMHPWLAELGCAALGETLSDLSGVRAQLVRVCVAAGRRDGCAARALREAEIEAGGALGAPLELVLRAAPLLVQELFLPAMGRVRF